MLNVKNKSFVFCFLSQLIYASKSKEIIILKDEINEMNIN